MGYNTVKLNTEVEIKEIVSVQYFEYPRDFAFLGEMHDFWEVIYSDKDFLSVTVRSKEEIIPPGHFRIISPMEFHSVKPADGKAANAVIFSFKCDNEKLYKSCGRTIPCDEEKKDYITKLITASKEAFLTPLEEPNSTCLVKNPNAVIGAENLVKIYIELFLLSCIRENKSLPVALSPLKHISDTRLSEICTFLENNVRENIDFTTLCETFGISGTNMKNLFRKHLKMGAMDYFSQCKINCAKYLIREKELNFSEIAEYLGFSSVQYFSRKFKIITTKTPSEYQKSVIK